MKLCNFKKIFTTICLLLSIFSSGYLMAETPSPNPLIVILLGPPGSGKGTQATLLQEKLHIPHISTGDLLRENVRNQTDLGKKADEFMKNGKLVPDNLILDMLFSRIAKEDCSNGYILDGFPRTEAQAKAYHKRLKNNVTNIVAVNLNLTDQKIVERLTKRLSCEKCGMPYHSLYSPPKVNGLCDKCHVKLKQRNDDKEEVVLVRLKVYKEQTAPLLKFYKKKKLLHQVSCENAKEKVLADILSEIKKE